MKEDCLKRINRRNIRSDELPKVISLLSLVVIVFLSGATVMAFRIFPSQILSRVFIDLLVSRDALRRQLNPYDRWWYEDTDETNSIPTYDQEATYDRLSLVVSIIEDNTWIVRVIDMNGDIVHSWTTDWFELWPNPDHIPRTDEWYPIEQPGTNIHGAQLLDNGDLVFNFEHLGLIKLDVCGDVVWRLPYRTHHSIYLDEHGSLWVSGNIHHTASEDLFPGHAPDFIEPTVLEISTDGEILTEISLMEVLIANEMEGLLYMSSSDNVSASPQGDTLHLNDVETFPSTMEEGTFQAGDIMVSLRNINTVFVFRQPDMEIVQLSMGDFVWQHDPDFVDGNTISIFNNFEDGFRESSIIVQSFSDEQSTVYYEGDEEHPFYTNIMGKHQSLPNGNMLITEATKGRAFEIDPDGNIVWEYLNILDSGHIGLVTEVTRLPEQFTPEFFADSTAACEVPATQ